MSDSDLKRIVAALDEALNVFRQYEGQLDVAEIRLCSMLSVVRKELVEHQTRHANPFGHESARTAPL